MLRRRGDLTWDTISTPSKIMLPAYVGLFAIVGLTFLFQEKSELLATPSLAFTEQYIGGIRFWGVLFFATAVMMIAAILMRWRSFFRFALLWGIILMIIWAFVLAAAALAGEATWSAWAWPLFAATACAASNKSLLAGEE